MEIDMKNHNATTGERLIRLPEVLLKLGISRSSWYAGIKSGRFPAPKKLGPKTSVWPHSTIETLIVDLTSNS